jgi:cystathionine beta-lyase/cystathionine gamma-synthase
VTQPPDARPPRHAATDAETSATPLGVSAYLNPAGCPADRPPLEQMSMATRGLHLAIDRANRKQGTRWLHPDGPTVQPDLFSSDEMAQWQEGQLARHHASGGWAALPMVYARYGTEAGEALRRRLMRLEHAAGVVLTDSGLQAATLVMDAVVRPGDHVLVALQSYARSRAYVRWLCERVGATWTVLDHLSPERIVGAARPETALVFGETYTDPRMRALDVERIGEAATFLRLNGHPRLRVAIDHTVATPWGFKKAVLEHPGVDVVVSAGTKALGGQDRDVWGYIASNDEEIIDRVTDLQRMRGGVLGWRAAEAVLAGLVDARHRFTHRCRSAQIIAAFLDGHPRVEHVNHPSIADHPDASIIRRLHALPGSLLSFHLAGRSEDETRHFCDVLASTTVVRYALSFDGLVSKVNHHRTVSEYFTPEAELERQGIDRLVRFAVGTEAPEDIIAALNWALWHFDQVSPEDLRRWRRGRPGGSRTRPT